MTTELVGVHGSMRIERPAPRVVVMRIRGHDIGELGDAPFREVDAEFVRRFGDLTDKMRICTDETSFDEALAFSSSKASSSASS